MLIANYRIIWFVKGRLFDVQKHAATAVSQRLGSKGDVLQVPLVIRHSDILYETHVDIRTHLEREELERIFDSAKVIGLDQNRALVPGMRIP